MSSLPEHIMRKGSEAKKETTVYGRNVSELSREELEAVAALAWSAHQREVALNQVKAMGKAFGL